MLILWLACVHFLFYAEANVNNVLEPREDQHKVSGVFQWRYEKRPFCNAFTGCGKKRTSSHPPSYPVIKRNNEDDNAKLETQDYVAEGLSDLIDINAEPAVENVQNQIMSQAKIYEAIKEASKEIFRQKNKQKQRQLNQMLEQEQLLQRQQPELKYEEMENV